MSQRHSERVDFWLGDRGEGRVTDFDGRVRACRVLTRIRFLDADRAEHLLVQVDPPLPMRSGKTVDRVVLGPRWQGDDLGDLPTGDQDGRPTYVNVYVYEVLEERSLAEGVAGPGAFRGDWFGEIALRPEFLPPTLEDNFDDMFDLLESFVAREGNANVPLEHRERSIALGVWVSNVKFEQANIGLRLDWAKRLEALPGWRWLSGSDFTLLEGYARREGTTRVPEDHFEEGRPLGRWVAQQRKLHASGQLAKDWETRLERIPGWEW